MYHRSASNRRPHIYQTAQNQRPPQSQRFVAPSGQLIRSRRLHPITHLPSELLVEVFKATIPANGGVLPTPTEPKQLYSLITVCRFWRDIIQNSAVFWQIIDVGRRLEWLALCLERSSHAMVKISFWSHELNFADALKLLASHSHRISTIAHPDLDPAALVASGGSPVPFPMSGLQVLAVKIRKVGRPDRTAPLFTLFDGYYPSLHTLCLNGFNFSIAQSCRSMVHIRYLALVNVSPNVVYKLTDLLTMLGSCSSLTYLTLSLITVEGTVGGAAGGRMAEVTLHNLRQITVSSQKGVIRSLLSNVVIPPRAHVKLMTVPNHAERVAILTDMLPEEERIRDRALPGLRLVSQVKVVADKEVVSVIGVIGHGPHSGGKIELVADVAKARRLPDEDIWTPLMIWYRTTLATLGRIFPPGPQLTTIEGVGDLEGMNDPAEWVPFSSSYPNVRDLVMEDCMGGGNSFYTFRALAGRLCPSQGVLFPRLENLRVRYAEASLMILTEIEGMVEWRIAQRAPLKLLKLELLNPGYRYHAITDPHRRLSPMPIWDAWGPVLHTPNEVLEALRSFEQKMRRLVPAFELVVLPRDSESERASD